MAAQSNLFTPGGCSGLPLEPRLPLLHAANCCRGPSPGNTSVLSQQLQSQATPIRQLSNRQTGRMVARGVMRSVGNARQSSMSSWRAAGTRRGRTGGSCGREGLGSWQEGAALGGVLTAMVVVGRMTREQHVLFGQSQVGKPWERGREREVSRRSAAGGTDSEVKVEPMLTWMEEWIGEDSVEGREHGGMEGEGSGGEEAGARRGGGRVRKHKRAQRKGTVTMVEEASQNGHVDGNDFKVWKIDGNGGMRESMSSVSSQSSFGRTGSDSSSSSSSSGSSRGFSPAAAAAGASLSVELDESSEEGVMGSTLWNGSGLTPSPFPPSSSSAAENGAASGGALRISSEPLTLAKEPVYQVLEVNSKGGVRQREVSRRQLLKLSGLTQRDVRRIDPSLWVTNSMPALLVREHAILLNLGSLRAISTASYVLIFDFQSVGAQSFLEVLLDRLKMDADALMGGGPGVPFELEVVESALISRTQRLEGALLDVEPKVLSLLEKLPNQLSADNLEELRLSKQALMELGSKAGALRQMLLELLEHTSDLRRITTMGGRCHVTKEGLLECPSVIERQLAEEEEEEVEMMLEYYLQRCDSCHGQAEKLLDSSKEMEDSISVNLSSRRLEVSRLELLLQVGTFASALGALVAGIFGMNLRNRFEESTFAFVMTTCGIVVGSIVLFLSMLAYLKRRRIL